MAKIGSVAVVSGRVDALKMEMSELGKQDFLRVSTWAVGLFSVVLQDRLSVTRLAKAIRGRPATYHRRFDRNPLAIYSA